MSQVEVSVHIGNLLMPDVVPGAGSAMASKRDLVSALPKFSTDQKWTTAMQCDDILRIEKQKGRSPKPDFKVEKTARGSEVYAETRRTSGIESGKDGEKRVLSRKHGLFRELDFIPAGCKL